MINVEDYIPLVHKLAIKEYRKIGFRYDYEDLFQVGCVGLMKAAKNFDETKGCKFLTYAYINILGTISNFMRNDRWYIAKDSRERLKNSYAPTSLDTLVGSEQDTPLMDFIGNKNMQNSSMEIRLILNKLPEKLKRIIELRYFYGYLQQEIAEMFSTTQATISRSEKSALQILKEEMMVC